MTPAQHTDSFVTRYNGKYIDEDGYYGSQCWDLIARYAREEYGAPRFPTGSGGAEGLYRIFAQPIPQYFDRVGPNDLQKGDIAVWGSDFFPPFGHTALVTSVNSDGTITVFEQNGANDPNNDGKADGIAYITKRGRAKLAGGLRPKGANGMITISDAEYQDLKNWKAQGMELMKERDTFTYPTINALRAENAELKRERDQDNYPKINAITSGLGLPSGATSEQISKAIIDLKAKATGDQAANEAIIKEKDRQLKEVTDNLANAYKEVDDLKKQLATQSGDTELLNGFGQFLQKLIVRLGLKK